MPSTRRIPGCNRRRTSWAAVVVFLTTGASAAAVQAKGLTLQQLLDMARASNPGLAAGAAATNAMEAQVSEAWRNWLPSGDILSVLAPSPTINCVSSTGVVGDVNDCVATSNKEASISNVSWTKVFTRTELKLIQPVYDFGKISAGVSAAEAGVGVSRERLAGARADIELNVRKAYYGVKLARDLVAMLEEGSGYIDDGIKKVDKDLAAGTGSVTVTDRLRLRTVRAEMDARLLEARRLGDLARSGLRTLLGDGAPEDLDVDEEDFVPIEVQERPIGYYEDLARFNRPEVRLLDHAVKAKRALADLERRKEYPDLVLIGSAAFAYAGAVQNPQNAYYSHYYNSASAGLAAALRIQLDLGPKLARAARSKAEASETEYRRTEALGGIALDVRKSYGELREATARTEALRKGERAGKSWISAVAQNFTVGLAEARDLTDALLAFFQMRARYLQSVFDQNVAAAALTRATGSSAL